MQIFKKIAGVSVSFLIIVSALSALIIEPFFHSEFEYYNDDRLRSSLSGTLDYLFVGASNGMCAFVPDIADKEMGVCSYNLSGGLMTWYGRYALLEKEINRNPVKNVVIEISYDALSREYHDSWGDNITICRLGSFKERTEYFFRNVNISEYDEIYGALTGDGFSYLISKTKNFVTEKILGGSAESLNKVPYESKGFHDKTLEGTCSLNVDAETAKKIYNSKKTESEFVDKNVKELRSIVDMCKGKGINVTFVVVPHSDYIIFEYDKWDELYAEWCELADEMGCRIVDFNLLKNRYELFKDSESFFDKVHLTRSGAETFTREYCRIMKQIEKGTDVSDSFYNSYSEMKSFSPYMKYAAK